MVFVFWRVKDKKQKSLVKQCLFFGRRCERLKMKGAQKYKKTNLIGLASRYIIDFMDFSFFDKWLTLWTYYND